MHHHLVTVPRVPLRQKVRHWLKIRVLIRIAQPVAKIPTSGISRFHHTGRVPVVAVSRSLFRPVNVEVSVARRDFPRQWTAFDVVLDEEQKKSCTVRWRRDARSWVVS